MAILDYQTLMLPVLQALEDGRECAVRELIERVAGTFDLSAEDRDQLLPSGRIPVYVNRIHWACPALTDTFVRPNTQRRVRIRSLPD
jgi:restriction system protein